ncbi:MAG: hypothetical protein FPO08_15595 [Geobacter sp.]|nr:MAG: hypothetical protein FPO08_15595 [Geobacter sp.]
MTNRAKINEVLAGRELMRIDSQHKQQPRENKKRNLIIITLIYGLGLIYSFWFHWGEKSPLIFLLPMILTMLYGVVIAVSFVYTNNRGNPLIFTDRGIVLPFIAANFWNEIESYEWEDFAGWNKVPGPTVFSMVEGTSLRINLNGAMGWFSTRWRDGRGGNVLATYLIFFSPEHITKAESIFAEYVIKRKCQQSAADGLR